MKELRKVPTDGVLQFDLTVKYFPGIIVRGKHDKGLLQALTAVIECLMMEYTLCFIMCAILCLPVKCLNLLPFREIIHPIINKICSCQQKRMIEIVLSEAYTTYMTCS